MFSVVWGQAPYVLALVVGLDRRLYADAVVPPVQVWWLRGLTMCVLFSYFIHLCFSFWFCNAYVYVWVALDELPNRVSFVVCA